MTGQDEEVLGEAGSFPSDLKEAKEEDVIEWKFKKIITNLFI